MNNLSRYTFLTFLLLSVFTIPVRAQNMLSKEAAIIAAMNSSAIDWNKGDLGSFMKMYTESSTMMMPTGPVGISSIRELYEKKYFNGKMPINASYIL